ncbi:MAG: hypothetical protein R3B60_04405 [Candidatus Paceibacterota bacterium]
MLRKFLIKLHKKPKSVRVAYAKAFASIFTGIIVIVWLVGMDQSYFNFSNNKEDNSGNSPFSGFIEESKEYMASLKEAVGSTETSDSETENIDLNEIIKNEVETTKVDEDFEEQNFSIDNNSYASTSLFGLKASSSQSATNTIRTMFTENGATTSEKKQDYREVQIVTTSSRNSTSTASSTGSNH